MCLLKIQHGLWPRMMPDLIKATVYESEIFPSSLLQINSSFTNGVQTSLYHYMVPTNTAFQANLK